MRAKKLLMYSFLSALALIPMCVNAQSGGTGSGGMQFESPSTFRYSFEETQATISASNGNISIIFSSEDLGNMNVNVFDQNGFVVYSKLVDASIQSTLDISTANFDSGYYEAIITNENDEIIAEETVSID